MDPLKNRETKESECSWQKSSLTFGCARHKLMTHYVHTGTVRDRVARQASRYDRENEAVLLCWHTYVNAFGRRQYLPDVKDYLPVRSITVCGKEKKLSHQCGSVSTGTGFRSVAKLTRFALSNAGGKTHKQALLGLLRAGKGSIWWRQFCGLGWENGWPEDVLCCHASQFQCIISTTSFDHFSIIFTHKNWSDIWN